jgi:glycerol uptake facilitator-like aquaporin
LTEFTLTFILVYVIFAVAFDTVDTTNTVKVDVPKGGDQEQLIDEQAGAQLVDKTVGRNLTIYTTSGSSKAGFAPLAIGLTLGFLCFIGGSTSGGAFNPARVFGPALLSGTWDYHYIYWLGDLSGAAFAGFVQSFLAHKPKQSSGNNAQS